MNNNEIRTKLLILLGAASSFRLIDLSVGQRSEDMLGMLKAAKETGKEIQDGLTKLISQIPKE